MKFLPAFLPYSFFGVTLVLTLLGAQSSYASDPEWYLDYLKSYPGCEQELLCSVGEGETLAEALGVARSEAAKFFQAQVKSKSQLESSSEQKGSSAASATFLEWSTKSIQVETSELISGMEIKKQEAKEGRFYVLMALERSKSAGALKDKIQTLDNQNNSLLEMNSRFAFPKMLKNLDLINHFNERYSLLARSPLKLKVSRETMQEKINKLEPMKIALLTRGKKLPTHLHHTLIDILAPLKVVVVAKKSNPAYKLRGEVLTEEQYFKVNGFKKLNVIYRLELLNSKNEIIGKMSTLSEQVARNTDHAIEKAIPEIKAALQDNLDQLSSK